MGAKLEKLEIFDRERLGKVWEFCMLEKPYSVNPDTDRLFIDALQEVIAWHQHQSNFYEKLLIKNQFSKDTLQSILDIHKIPFIFANFFKKYEVLSIDKKDVFLHLTSSGTTGQKSQIFFDEWSIKSAQRMVDLIFNYYGWITPHQKCNYLLYTYEPEKNFNLGTSYTDNFLCKYAPINEVSYALKNVGDGEHKFDLFGCIEVLQKYEEAQLPVRIFGFPAFLYFTLEHMKKIKMPPIKLHKESLVFLGGGWKGHQDKVIEKKDFYDLAGEYLNIPDERLRDGFGSVEHCIPYIECKSHHFHVPVWSQIIIRDVKTLKPLGPDQVGYLNFISPYITSVPANSVLMGDLAILHAGSDCPCELETPWFDIVGRAGTSKNKSCAMKASELLNKF
ncbi:MAG: acyl-protein synthase [Bdellovibrionales bacterium RIFOXYB1_FULL_37_110]|nr:MAG: acyl-protein synthase [Bdellovibrionales bacterium RIFOXYA1_FULL_38_20]OFZ51697.1 MAG: acyl-protein synthase [Bdellovibrionales bacterium RIFOXYC1_FULL_37_79]OFZ60529.1 MAG: acyl-protein synthase [Bdellovibrionales bacterium RIFOXYB1_FULL_37_110]OFZ65043.1 MAG: acyl-protein synthase [Bdellovibrionales bacterium RIFOXYD1_FULL_36_51]